MSTGEDRVRVNFNVDGDSAVDKVKQETAHLIDGIELHGKDRRLTALAMTAYEEAAMWAVKSLTAPILAENATDGD